MAADVLSDLLKTVRLTGAAFFDIAAEAPWAVASPPRDAILPKILPGADHLVAYHVVTAGRCFATIVGGKPIAVEAGEVVVFAHGDPHIMSSGPGMHADPTPADVLDVAAADQLPFHLNYAGTGPASTTLVCGYLACDARPFNPLLEALPPVITSGSPRNQGGRGVSAFIQFAVAEAAEKRAGGETILTKLSELMFIEVLRGYIASLPSENAGWLAGLRDPLVGRILSLIHGKPKEDWTIDRLAKEAGVSRSVLAERFSEVVGIPPMHYLAKWRMQIASELLSGSTANIAAIAIEAGYESEAAFSRAFKKMVGVPPSSWRQRVRFER
ncbi:MAG: AraC family transcriptional regulator [Actinomycetota bacterium]